jgi:hypothetical protein
MQRTTLQQHKDIVITCEEGDIKMKRNNQSIIPKPMFATMTTLIIGDVKTSLFCTNYKHINQAMKTWHSKKKEEIVTSVIEVMAYYNKSAKPMRFPCHVCVV